ISRLLSAFRFPMYELSHFRSNTDTIAQRLAARGFTLDVATFQKLDAERRAALTEDETLKAERNAASKEIGRLKKAGEDTEAAQAKVREMGERSAELKARAEALDTEL